MKQNCWDFKNCGRSPGGHKTGELGVCPASTAAEHNGVNSGQNAGRFCWKVSGTFCSGQVQGTFASNMAN